MQEGEGRSLQPGLVLISGKLSLASGPTQKVAHVRLGTHWPVGFALSARVEKLKVLQVMRPPELPVDRPYGPHNQ